MAFIPDEGEAFLAVMVVDNVSTNRGSSLELGLFTDVSPGDSITESTITEPTGDYARISLADVDWTPGTGNLRTFAEQTFQAGTGGWPEGIRGGFICTTGSTKILLTVAPDAGGPYTLSENDTYKITPTLQFTGIDT